MILNQVNMPQLLNLQVVLRDRLHPDLVDLRLQPAFAAFLATLGRWCQHG